jgi:hypothetical protein
VTLDKIDHGLTFDGTQASLAQYMESWLSGKRLARRPSTVRNYRRYMNLYCWGSVSVGARTLNQWLKWTEFEKRFSHPMARCFSLCPLGDLV